MISDFNLYFNLFFFGSIALGALFGFKKGLKKSLYSIIVKAIFYIVFFVTLNSAIQILWTMPIPNADQILSGLNVGVSGVNTLSEMLPIFIESMFGNNFETTLQNENFLSFATALSMFIVKIIYAIFYFTVINTGYKVITYIVGKIIIRSPKGENVNKMRLGGMGAGALSGLMSVFMTMILLGGFMDFSTSLLTLTDGLFDSEETHLVQMEGNPEGGDLGDVEESMNTLSEMSKAYQENALVKLLSLWTHTNQETGYKTPQNLHLFDMIFSINYEEYDIKFRHEMKIFSDVGQFFVGNDFMTSQNISDLDPDKLKQSVSRLSNSELLIAIMPLAIELGADYADVDLSVSSEELYGIDWANEINQMGIILGSGVEILIAAGVFEDDTTLKTATFDGNSIETFFDSLSETEIFTMNSVMDIFLQRFGGDFVVHLDVPQNMDWSQEFKAFGTILGALANTDITMGELQEQNFNAIFTKLSSFDLEMVLDSHLLEMALINTLDNSDNNILMIPDNIIWQDDDQEDGELRLLLRSFNLITNDLIEVDFANLDINMFLSLENETIETTLESSVIHATLGNLVYNLTNENQEFIIPNSVVETTFVNNNTIPVVSRIELSALLNALKEIDFNDASNLNFGLSFFDEIENTSTLFESKIVHASFSKIVLELSSGPDAFLMVPTVSASESDVAVYDAMDDIDYIVSTELVALIDGLIDLGVLDDFENIENLNFENINQNFDNVLLSSILHLTISDNVLNGISNGLTVPDENAFGVELKITPQGTADTFLEEDELKALFVAFEEIGLSDLNSVSIDSNNILSNNDISLLLESASFQMTISEMILPNSYDETNISIPQGNLIITSNHKVSVPVNGVHVDMIEKDELVKMLEGFVILGVDVNGTFGGNQVASAINDINILLESESIHLTINNMVKTNANLSIPDLALYDTLYSLVEDVIIASELENFLIATNVFVNETGGTGDFTSADFSLSEVNSIGETERGIIFNSMIVRNILTEEIEMALISFGQNPSVYFDNSDYEENDRNNFLKKESIEAFLNDYSALL